MISDFVLKHSLKKSAEQKSKQLEKNRAHFNKSLHERRANFSKSTPITTNESTQREKRLRKRVQKELNGKEKKLEQNKQVIREQRQRLKENEETIAKLQQERWETKQQLSQIQGLEDELNQKDVTIKEEKAKRILAEQTIQQLQLEYEHTKRKTGANKLAQLSNQVKQLKQSNQSLRRQVENHDLLSRQKYGDLEQEVRKLHKELQIYRQRENRIQKNPMYLMRYMQQYITSDYLPDLLELVEDFITMENLHHFYRGQHNLFYLLMRRVNLLHYHSKNNKKRYRLRHSKNTNEMMRLGYLSCENNRWLFVDVTKNGQTNTYPVTRNVSNEELVIDRPVKAFLHQEGVTVTKCFQLESAFSNKQPIKKKPVKSTAQEREYLWLGNFTVLVIGSRFMNEYKYRLQKHGCLVELHNPYEQSFEVLKGKIKRAEIILVCERHIPHSIWDYVDKNQPFVSVLQQDSKDLISTFTYITLQRCELI
ncbi:hypothetical protein [Lentibacillus sp. Marseille-P4043]|uniref:hypothetical protein n=1 Tax=Lentibacillus sp. Marseille-P4043 TaxID=2040293 RepID=UPI000D0B6574|nr:hypothetical protein [Lentibacillus sp. Marseille-P4043]